MFIALSCRCFAYCSCWGNLNDLECAVIGISRKEWGEAVHAAVVTRDKQVLSIEEIVAYCRGKIGGYKIPKSVTCSTELLPMTGSGKVSKRQIRDTFWQGQTTKI